MNLSTFNRARFFRSTAKNISTSARRVHRATAAVVELLEQRALLSTVLTPVADSFVRGGAYQNTNFGASPLLFVKTPGSGDFRTAYLKFDLSNAGTIHSAILHLSGSLLNPLATSVTTGVFPVSDTTWIAGNGAVADPIGDGFDTSNNPPGELTWNNRPTIGPTALNTATITRDSYQSYNLDITSYIQAQQGPLVSLALEDTVANMIQNVFLSSKSTSNAGSGPELIINGDSAEALVVNSINAPDVTSSSDSHTETVSVNYLGPLAVDPSTFSASNITVTPYGGGTALTVTGVSTSGTTNADGSITVNYTIAAPGGAWAASANGAYVVAVQPNSVKDVQGNGVSGETASFRVKVGDTTPPVSVPSATDVLTPGAGTYSFNVTYSDNVAIDASQINLANVGISGPIGQLQITGMSLSPNANASQITVTYTAIVPGGAWTSADDGVYTLGVRPNSIFDTAGNPDAVVGNNVTFHVRIPVAGTTPPTAVISAANVTAAGGTTETVMVTYFDAIGIDASTINTGNISVIGPNNQPLTVVSSSVSPGTNAAMETGTYIVAAPGGTWDAADIGPYTITVLADQVFDTSSNPVPVTTQQFRVDVPTTPPTASISAANITSVNSNPELISVVYTDSTSALDPSTLSGTNLTVTDPNSMLITATLVAMTGSGSSVTGRYTIPAPAGGWTLANNGTYTVAVVAGSVKDMNGDGVVATSSTFTVAIADATAPTAVITAPNVTSSGGSGETITVVYSDNVAVDAATISIGNLSVIGPNSQPLTVTGVTTNPTVSAASVTATYTVAAPGGAWTATANGMYTVSLIGGQVKDTSGNAASAAPVTFNVNASGTPPAAAITAPDVTSTTAAAEIVTVLYTDPNSAIDITTLSGANLTVIAPVDRTWPSAWSTHPAAGIP